MAGQLLIDGVDVTSHVDLSRYLSGGITCSANGSDVGVGGIRVDDTTGTLDIDGWQTWEYHETTATPTRVSGGLVGKRVVSEGDLLDKPGTARFWDVDLFDLNAYLGLLVVRGSSAKRPAETDQKRIAWLLDDATGGISATSAHPVYDNGGVVFNPPLNHGADDLRGKYPQEILDAMRVDVRDFYVYWDDTAATGQEISLRWSRPDVPRGHITEKLSNVRSEIDGSTIFAAMAGQSLDRDPTQVVSGIYLTTRAGTIYRTNSATAAAFTARDQVYSTDRIASAGSAETLAARLLVQGSTERDTITCSVVVDNDDVNIFREGYSVDVKFTHLPEYDDFVTLRILYRNVRRPETWTSRYVIDLTLSANAPASIGGGGDTGDLPHPPPGQLSIIQKSVGRSSRTMPNADTADGDVLVLLGSNRGGAPVQTGYTDSGEGSVSQGAADYVKVGYKTALADGDTWNTSTSDDAATGWYEISAGATLTAHASNHGSSLTASTADVSVPAGGIAFVVAGLGNGGDFDHGGYNDPFAWTAPAGWIKDYNNCVASGHPSSLIGYYQNSTSSAVTISPVFTFFDNGEGARNWQIIVVAFGPDPDSASNPPETGQPVPLEVVTVDPDGPATTYRTAFPFADGSLRVFIKSGASGTGGVEQTGAVIAQSGECGDFQLDFVPRSYEVVSVTYQGR